MHRYRNPRVELRDGQEDSLCHYSSWTACFLSPVSWFCWSEILPTCSPSLPLHLQDSKSVAETEVDTATWLCLAFLHNQENRWDGRCKCWRDCDPDSVYKRKRVLFLWTPFLSIYFSLPPLPLASYKLPAQDSQVPCCWAHLSHSQVTWSKLGENHRPCDILQYNLEIKRANVVFF